MSDKQSGSESSPTPSKRRGHQLRDKDGALVFIPKGAPLPPGIPAQAPAMINPDAAEVLADAARSIGNSPEPIGDKVVLPQLIIGSSTYPQLADEIGRIAGRFTSDLYRQGERLLSVNHVKGELKKELVTASGFCGWLEEHADVVTWKKDPETKKSVLGRCHIPKAMAEVILSMPRFQNHVRELAGVYLMRLPVWFGTGEDRTIKLLAEGYDRDTKILIYDHLKYDQDLDPGEAQTWLLDILREFPWAELQHDPSRTPRSLAVHIGAMLAPFCSVLFGESHRRPAIIYNAAEQGSGKTLLAKMAHAAVFGEPAMINASKTRADEFEKKIETAIIDQRSYLCIDDCTSIDSGALNMLLTSGVVSVRRMSTNDMQDRRNRMQLMITGNAIRLEKDMMRRSLIADLFFAGDLQRRRFAQPITEDWLFSTATRAQLCAVLWAFVRHWRDERRCERFEDAYRPGFEEFASIIGSIVQASGLPNPFADRDEDALGGDAKTAMFRDLMRELAESIKGEEAVFTGLQILQTARELEVSADLFSGRDEKGEVKSVGHVMRVNRGKTFITDTGRKFTIGGSSSTRARSKYLIKFLPPP